MDTPHYELLPTGNPIRRDCHRLDINGRNLGYVGKIADPDSPSTPWRAYSAGADSRWLGNFRTRKAAIAFLLAMDARRTAPARPEGTPQHDPIRRDHRLSGSSKEYLLDDISKATEALNEAIAMVASTAPHQRDFHTDNFARAQAAHKSRMDRLESVLAELTAQYLEYDEEK